VRPRTALIMALLAGSATAHAQTPPASLNVYAIVGARIEVGDGRVIDKGTVLIRDGLIEAVGASVTVPPEAQVIKGDGLVVYPGFIDAHATSGLQPPDAQPNQDTPPDTTLIAPPFMREANRKGVRPELEADNALAFTDAILRPARQSGFTTELLVPTGGTITGVGSLVNLSGEPKRDCVVRPAVAMGFTFSSTGGRGFGGGGGGGGYPGSLMGIMALTRQTLLDAQHYAALQTAFDHGASRRAPDDAVLAALQPVLRGDMPVIYDADSENEIRRTVKMADEFGLKLILSGGGEGWKASSLLAQKKVPVLLTLNFGVDPTAPPQAAGGPGGRFGGGFPGGGRGRGRQGGAGRNGGAPGGQAPTGTPPAGPTDINGAPGGAPPPPNGQPQTGPPRFGPGSPGSPSESRPTEPDVEDDTPKAVKQEQHRKWEEKVANAAQLAKAGVPFAFSTRGVRNAAEFFTNLRAAIKAGLPRATALRALTIDAARLFGVERQLGTVEAGKTAALVVMSGDFADERTRTRYVFIDRTKFDLDNDAPPLTPAPTRFFPADDDDDEGGH
jgi:imidazolonepropionase-like amidohydrolase